jgi:hypothetical protein
MAGAGDGEEEETSIPIPSSHGRLATGQARNVAAELVDPLGGFINLLCFGYGIVVSVGAYMGNCIGMYGTGKMGLSLDCLGVCESNGWMDGIENAFNGLSQCNNKQ